MRNQGVLKEHLARVDLFRFLNEPQFAKLLAILGHRVLAKNEVLFWEQDPGDALFVILKGTVEISTLSADGREQILAILGPGELLGEMSIFDHQPRSATARALEISEIAVLERKAFEQVLRTHPDLAMGMLKSLSERLRDTNARLEELVFKGVQPRIAGILLELATNHGKPSPQGTKLGIKLTHQQLANYVGTSRETVTRTLLTFQDAGWIGFHHRYLVIYNHKALSEFAQSAS